MQSDKITTLLDQQRFVARDSESVIAFLRSTISLGEYVTLNGIGRNTSNVPNLDSGSDSDSDGEEDYDHYGEESEGEDERESIDGDGSADEPLDDEGPDEWRELATGNFIRDKVSHGCKWVGSLSKTLPQQVGTSFVAKYGTDRQEFFALAVVEMHCGFFAYQPSLQSRVHRLNLLVTAKTQVATCLAHRTEPKCTRPSMDAFREEVERACNELGLNTVIKSLREELDSLSNGLQVLGNLPCLQMSREEISEKVKKHSVIMQRNRARGESATELASSLRGFSDVLHCKL